MSHNQKNCFFAEILGRILNGQQIEITHIPYQAQLNIDDWLFCGGAIIAPNAILSAAHCFP